MSIISSTTRGQRLVLGRVRQQSAKPEAELANANQEVAEAELEEAQTRSQACSIGRLADVQSEGGNSANARPKLSVELVVLPLMLERVPESAPPQETQGGNSSPAEAGSEAQGPTYLLQQNLINEGCLFGSQTVNSWQDAHTVIDSVKQFAELRQQGQ